MGLPFEPGLGFSLRTPTVALEEGPVLRNTPFLEGPCPPSGNRPDNEKAWAFLSGPGHRGRRVQEPWTLKLTAGHCAFGAPIGFREQGQQGHR